MTATRDHPYYGGYVQPASHSAPGRRSSNPNRFTEWLVEEGFAAVAVADNAEARQAIAGDDEFALYVLNIRLPDGDGRDFCRDLRRYGIDAPVLIQSGYNDIENIQRAMLAGADDFLSKPFDKKQLIERIRFLLALPPVQRQFSRARRPVGSNLPTAREICLPRIDNALRFLESVRPMPGTLPTFDRIKEEPQPLPFDEKMADELADTLRQARDILLKRDPDPETLARIRATLLHFGQMLLQWLAARATVVTDEGLKIWVKVAAAAYLANSFGLKDDLFYLVALLGGIAHPGH